MIAQLDQDFAQAFTLELGVGCVAAERTQRPPIRYERVEPTLRLVAQTLEQLLDARALADEGRLDMELIQLLFEPDIEVGVVTAVLFDSQRGYDTEAEAEIRPMETTYLLIADRLVKITRQPDGTSFAWVVNPATNTFIQDGSYLDREGISLTEAEFEARRAAAAAETLDAALAKMDREELRAQVTALIKTIDPARAPQAPTPAELGKLIAAIETQTGATLDGSLRVIASWLRAPTPEHLAKLETLARSLGWDPAAEQAREEARQDREIEANVKHSLDEIFGKLDFKL